MLYSNRNQETNAPPGAGNTKARLTNTGKVIPMNAPHSLASAAPRVNPVGFPYFCATDLPMTARVDLAISRYHLRFGCLPTVVYVATADFDPNSGYSIVKPSGGLKSGMLWLDAQGEQANLPSAEPLPVKPLSARILSRREKRGGKSK